MSLLIVRRSHGCRHGAEAKRKRETSRGEAEGEVMVEVERPRFIHNTTSGGAPIRPRDRKDKVHEICVRASNVHGPAAHWDATVQTAERAPEG
jgi:hypothetical protein